jgi:hypothetical protein
VLEFKEVKKSLGDRTRIYFWTQTKKSHSCQSPVITCYVYKKKEGIGKRNEGEGITKKCVCIAHPVCIYKSPLTVAISVSVKDQQLWKKQLEEIPFLEVPSPRPLRRSNYFDSSNAFSDCENFCSEKKSFWQWRKNCEIFCLAYGLKIIFEKNVSKILYILKKKS